MSSSNSENKLPLEEQIVTMLDRVMCDDSKIESNLSFSDDGEELIDLPQMSINTTGTNLQNEEMVSQFNRAEKKAFSKPENEAKRYYPGYAQTNIRIQKKNYTTNLSRSSPASAFSTQKSYVMNSNAAYSQYGIPMTIMHSRNNETPSIQSFQYYPNISMQTYMNIPQTSIPIVQPQPQYRNILMSSANPFGDPSLSLIHHSQKMGSVQLNSQTQMMKNFANQSPKKISRNCKTTITPQDKNLKNEMVFLELEAILAKLEKIDYFLYAKLQGHFENIIRNQKGSRIFQNYLKNTSHEIIHAIFQEILGNLLNLLIDPYANYFCQKFYGYLSQKDRIVFLKTIQSSLMSLSVHKVGTYPIQWIIEQLGSRMEKELVINGIKDHLVELSFDTYGTHILEKIMATNEDDLVGFIYEYIVSNIISLANNCYGLCIVKKLIMLNRRKDLHERIKGQLVENALSLVQNAYGNYALQISVDFWDVKETEDIITQFKGRYTNLSMQKYSSNVVERCLEKSEEYLNEFINEVCHNNRIADVMKNNFGNYVVQKALKLSSGLGKSTLLEAISKNLQKLGEKKLIAKWKSILLSYTSPSEGKNLMNDLKEEVIVDQDKDALSSSFD